MDMFFLLLSCLARSFAHEGYQVCSEVTDGACWNDFDHSESTTHVYLLQSKAHALSGTTASKSKLRGGSKLGHFHLQQKIDAGLLQWPEGFETMSKRFDEGTKLGRGGQGEVWKAVDLLTGEQVAVKLYLRYAKDANGILHIDGYQDFSTATTEERKLLEESKKGCEWLQMLERQRAVDPTGQNHILRCIENNIENDLGLPSHVVLELGGPDAKHWMKVRNGTHGDPEEARRIVAETAAALRFLQVLDPPVVHHDLKPENVMLVAKNDEQVVKLFDFGCATNATEEGRHADIASSFPYQDRETMRLCADPSDKDAKFKLPAWSYDIYSLGIMYLNLLCPSVGLGIDPSSAMLWLQNFVCTRPPLGSLEYVPNRVRTMLNQTFASGAPKCPTVSEEEVKLIEVMTGPSDRRPSPSAVLSRPWMQKYVH